MKITFLLLVLILIISCKGTSSSTTSTTTDTAKSCTDIESQITSKLNSTTTTDNLPFTYIIERLSDGKQYVYSKSGSTPTTSYESASTSKWVSGLIIMKAIEDGYLTLSTKPQTLITSWPITSSDSLYNITLANLVSFTSGLTAEPTCINLAASNFNTCVNNAGTLNANNGITPGTAFYYDSSHLQVAGKMVMQAKSMSDWQAVFSDFKTQTGLFSTSTYDLPSSTNPRLAGGVHWTANEYIAFLRKLAKNELLSASSMSTYLQDRTSNVTMSYSPVKDGIGEEWHYGMGYWHECQNSTWNCTAASRISSPGAYGSYPFWDRTNNYIGIVARQGSLGTYPYGIQVERAVHSLSVDWASCK